MIALGVTKFVNNPDSSWKDGFNMGELLDPNTFAIKIFSFHFFVGFPKGMISIDVSFKDTLYSINLIIKKKRPDLLGASDLGSTIIRINY